MHYEPSAVQTIECCHCMALELLICNISYAFALFGMLSSFPGLIFDLFRGGGLPQPRYKED